MGPILGLYSQAMKITLDIDGGLLASAKGCAEQRRITLTQFFEEGLRLRLQSPSPQAKTMKVKLPILEGRGGLAVGINPSTHRAMPEI